MNLAAPSDSEKPRAQVGGPAVELVGVRAGYRSHVALDGVNLAVPRGSMMAVVGPNGGGKSTLLKVLLGLLQP
jgi:ABC-type Mn2+/Zn2+ transport system ATPase subunit